MSIDSEFWNFVFKLLEKCKKAALKQLEISQMQFLCTLRAVSCILIAEIPSKKSAHICKWTSREKLHPNLWTGLSKSIDWHVLSRQYYGYGCDISLTLRVKCENTSLFAAKAIPSCEIHTVFCKFFTNHAAKTFFNFLAL